MKIPFHTSSCREGYGCASECEVRWLLEEHHRWRKLAYVFDNHYVCDPCESKAAGHFDDCTNPLHEIHEAIYAELTEEK